MRDTMIKEICFKDTKGSPLFQINDGSSIVLQALDNKPVVITCNYIDERSFYLKNARFSFKEFAELVEKNSCIFYPEHGSSRTYEIYQITSDKGRDYLFMRYSYAEKHFQAKHYEKMYMGMLADKTSLESIFYKHNLDYRPFAQKMRSVSVSDVIVINDYGTRKAYYVDSFGFVEVPKFLAQLQRMKNKEPSR